MINKRSPYFLFTLLLVLLHSCVEPFEIETETFESAIVIEATITNEFKHQEIFLTRTFAFEEEGPTIERNAEVKIIDDSQTVYPFEENSPGIYKSVSKFSAEVNKTYELQITTSDGRIYSSNPAKLTTGISTIDDVFALNENNSLGEENVIISVGSFDPTGNSKFYRYQYEETYQIRSRFPSDSIAQVVSNQPPFEVTSVRKNIQDKICYNTVKSNTIIQTETTNLIEDRVTKFPIRFIDKADFILRSRYSILVKQFVQSLEAFTFYKVLNELTNSESLFSQTQPGFFNGNVFSTTNSNEKVLGYFEISSVSSKRIFFNYNDIFPDEDLPPYIIDCPVTAPDLVSEDGLSSPLINAIQTQTLSFIQLNTSPPISEDEIGPFIMASPRCVDCTLLGSNIEPNFWIE